MYSVLKSKSPAQSPVKGRAVRLAPRNPGARPTIKSRLDRSPKDGTGALYQSGFFILFSVRKPFNRGHNAQSFVGFRYIGKSKFVTNLTLHYLQ